ncbi:hypothetical protein BV22DRAFT_929004 [Leucogyrophana mollusca]|uniref:Uncharacterized protein n=1 Tax=Leucogyrophana mollusca TaxID=85980 RepID=A0ACB8AYV9_9AGAM|nr:hypothetical protein BV22DRAFT_929004 [Leucogyrophana mollusca]
MRLGLRSSTHRRSIKSSNTPEQTTRSPQTIPSHRTMASAIAVLSNLQCVLYATVAAVAAILYDQILNFSQEVDFIWNRHWTIVTALYFVARYCGSASQLAYVAAYLPLDWTAAVTKSINIAFQVLNIMFTTAMQAILLIRAYALCNRSRKVLVFLLVSFVCEMAAIVVVLVKTLDLTAMGGFETYMVRIGSVIDPLSTQSYAVNLWQTISRATQLAFDILLLVVALFGSVQHALETKRFTKGWSINPLVKILVEDQIAYFVWYAGNFLTLSSVHLLWVR